MSFTFCHDFYSCNLQGQNMEFDHGNVSCDGKHILNRKVDSWCIY